MNRRTCLLAAAATLVLGACGREPDANGAAGSGNPSDALFRLTLSDLASQPQPLAQWRGQPVLVNFWATWCAPCVEEMPDLNALQAEFPGVRFLGLGVDSADALREFSERIPVDYPLLAARAEGLDLMRALGSQTGGLPYTVLIDSASRIRHTVSGQIDPAALRAQLRGLN